MGLWVDAAISLFQLTLFFWKTIAYSAELDFKILTGLQTGPSGATPSLYSSLSCLRHQSLQWVLLLGYKGPFPSFL